jgi:GxxExxY protein
MNSYFIPESDEIYRFAWSVWHRLGNGVTREIYADALELEFFDAGVPYQRDQHIPVYYKNILLPHDYMADFIVRDKIVLRIAAGADITETDKREIVSMLNTSKLSSGMFINYSDSAPQFNRIVAEAKFYTENKSASIDQLSDQLIEMDSIKNHTEIHKVKPRVKARVLVEDQSK